MADEELSPEQSSVKTEQAWTPGEWRVRNHPGRGGIWVDAPDGVVANDRGPSYARQILEDGDYAEKLADANLVAAAPELYAALDRCEQMVSTDAGPPDWDWIRSILAKARGERS